MSKLDTILEKLYVTHGGTVRPKTLVKEEIKQLMLDIIGEDAPIAPGEDELDMFSYHLNIYKAGRRKLIELL